MRSDLRFPRRPRVSVAALAVMGLATLSPIHNAMAQGAKIDVSSAIQKVRSGDEASVRAGLDELRVAGPGGTNGAGAVIDALFRGLSEPLTLQAIETLGELEAPSASAVLGQYAMHRTLLLRRAAVRALGKTRSPASTAPLRRALTDPEPSVRGFAATALGEFKARDATKDLVLALDHNVREAGAAIGQTCAADSCLELAARVGKLPLEVLVPGVEAVVFRADLADDVKGKLLVRIGQLETVEANRFLKGLENRLPKGASPKTRHALAQAIANTTGAVR